MTPVHQLGLWLREFMMQIPLPIVRGLFIAVPVVIMVWVWTLPRGETEPTDHPARWDEKLKWIATAALGAQIVIYCTF
ncbi:MAG: hypothetical protein O2955_13515 [Planctomycetota bacterium]|nr:hypothetical protein [Planctomycetota bacterium]MDA1213528.1 hypothetical protein [Planctomycetota bacterium]